jgi:4-hydroxy-tetrahydrodipicolinate synthase
VRQLPALRCLVAAVATPVTQDYRPDRILLAQRCQSLVASGCDGIALFGTTGEGGEFSGRDRMATLEALLEHTIDAQRLIISAGASAIADVVELAAHATRAGVAGVLVMPPSLYRNGITDEGLFRFYASIVERVGNPGLKLYLYHFPAICGAWITPALVRRLSERYSGMIAGIKDSGGDLGYTDGLLRRFSHLAVMTGTEIHVPHVLGGGGRGTICGLANVVPRLMRAMMDASDLLSQRRFLPRLIAVDNLLSRGSFIAAVKAIIANVEGAHSWRRVVPPSSELSLFDERRLVSDFMTLQAQLPPSWRESGEAGSKTAAE